MNERKHIPLNEMLGDVSVLKFMNQFKPVEILVISMNLLGFEWICILFVIDAFHKLIDHAICWLYSELHKMEFAAHRGFWNISAIACSC